MRFEGTKMIAIDNLKLTQLYLSQEKIDRVSAWFSFSFENFTPICVRDFLEQINKR